jgi:hypothetical protein
LGSAEWTKVGTGSPAAITVNENRWPTLAVADDTLLKVGACRPAAAGVVVGGAVVVGGVVVTVVLDVETGKIGAGATGAEEMVTTRLCGVVPTAFVAVRSKVEAPADVGMPEMVAVPSALSVSVRPAGIELEELI